jgi:hypothetical protein
MIAVAIVAFAAAAAGIGSRASYGAQTTADEPHYLLTALSIAHDGDLDVRDEFARMEYLPFHEILLDPQAAPRADGSLIEPHDPLLPVLLAAPTALGGWVLAKLTLAAVAAALAALLVWIAVRRFGVPVVAAAVVVGVFAASAPLAAYGSQIYPELPAALLVAVAIAALTGPLGQGGLAALGIAVVALPWLSVKYAPVAAVLGAIALGLLLRAGRRRTLVAMAGALVATGAAFLVVHQGIYGGVTPYASGSHFVDGEFTVVGSPDYLGRSRRIVGLLVDQDFGIAAWQPAWLLLVPAAAAMLARRPRGWPALLLPLAAGWFVATFVALTMQGWWFPGRQLVVVLPAAVLAVAWWARRGGGRLAVAAALGAVGVLAQAWVGAEGALGRIAWVLDLQSTSNPLYRAWTAVLPDYLAENAATWPLHWAWAAGLAAVAVLAWRAERARSPTAPIGEAARAAA